MITTDYPERKSGVFYTKPIKSIVPENYCYIEKCPLNSMFQCEICKNHICLQHKIGKLNEFLVCCNCYYNSEYTDIINSNVIYHYNKNKRNKYFQKFLNCISFEWTHKVNPEY